MKASIEAAIEQARTRRRLPEPTLRRYLRERAGLSQDAVARAVGVEVSTISRWERGTREPRYGAALAAYLDVLDRLAAER
jgi:transcriptional regulator with XRE-family HTH domain